MTNDHFSCIIIDDEPKAIELLRETINDLYTNISVLHTFTNWKDALPALRKNNFEILFLDISMPQKTGIDLLQLVPELKSEIIFVTAYPDYALEAFNVAAAGYILKPIKDANLTRTVDKTIERIRLKRSAREVEKQAPSLSNKIAIPNNKGLDYVYMNEIIYLEATGRYTRIVEKSREILSTYNLGKFRDLLSDYAFYQVHRSFIVNMNYISRYESTGLLFMSNGSEIPVAKQNREDFLNFSHKLKRS